MIAVAEVVNDELVALHYQTQAKNGKWRDGGIGKFHRFSDSLKISSACGVIMGGYGNDGTIVIAPENAHSVPHEQLCKRCFG